MDPIHRFTTLPVTRAEASTRALAEVDAAVGLVRSGASRRVRIVGLADTDCIEPQAIAHAHAAGVDVALERRGPTVVVIVSRST